jgi:hypothetical protein
MNPKSFNIVWKNPWPATNKIALAGFPTEESADKYIKEYYTESKQCYKLLCVVEPDYENESYRNEYGDYDPRLIADKSIL